MEVMISALKKQSKITGLERRGTIIPSYYSKNTHLGCQAISRISMPEKTTFSWDKDNRYPKA